MINILHILSIKLITNQLNYYPNRIYGIQIEITKLEFVRSFSIILQYIPLLSFQTTPINFSTPTQLSLYPNYKQKNSNLQTQPNPKHSQMITQLKSLQQYLIANKMENTLQSLRAEILSKYPQAPSNQFTQIFQLLQTKKNIGKNVELTGQNSSKKTKVQDKLRNQLVVQGLLGKIAYSSKLLQDTTINTKISKLVGNKIFQKAMTSMFPQSKQKLQSNNIQYIESSFEFKDQLDLIQASSNINNQSLNLQQNGLSHIQMEQEESSIVSQPSLVLEQLNKNQIEDGYTDDNDYGYYEFVFGDEELIHGCSKLTQKYGFPEKAVKKNSKEEINTKKPRKNKQNGSKFPQGVNFPNSNDPIYPRQFNGVFFDVLKIKVIFDREKTGFEEEKQLNFSQGQMLAGRYRVQAILGSGVFAKVLKVYDTIKKQPTCLKMIANNKDYFDQSLDEIKILRYINANCNPDQHNLLKFKGVFYHREHLFIQTDQLKDNLFVAYRKNPAFFSIPIIRQITKQILQGIKVLHLLHIMHADLKPQNILIKSYNPIKIKIVDLGNSCFFHDHLGQYVQSRSYRAPEVVLGTGYTEKIDIWSVGCIVAQLWTKNMLFYNVHIQGMLARIQSIVGPWPEWMLDRGNAVEHYFSKENLIFFEEDKKFHILIPKPTTLKARIRTDDEKFLGFLEATLKIDPNFRLSAEEALEHPFIKGN